MAQRLARVEEEVHDIRGALGEQREVMDAMAEDLSRFTVWAAGGISQLLDYAGATYDSRYGDLAGKEIDKVGEVSIIWNLMCVL
ncbi:hypothetical protein Tco_1141137 [Tanacetum coccineum]